uniref:Uncharacterized protein n=1 Tax=Lepeophtheirus salmonis TaxID=72036 RepID=A0A0K2VE24_LEPSM
MQLVKSSSTLLYPEVMSESIIIRM